MAAMEEGADAPSKPNDVPAYIRWIVSRRNGGGSRCSLEGRTMPAMIAAAAAAAMEEGADAPSKPRRQCRRSGSHSRRNGGGSRCSLEDPPPQDNPPMHRRRNGGGSRCSLEARVRPGYGQRPRSRNGGGSRCSLEDASSSHRSSYMRMPQWRREQMLPRRLNPNRSVVTCMVSRPQWRREQMLPRRKRTRWRLLRPSFWSRNGGGSRCSLEDHPSRFIPMRRGGRNGGGSRCSLEVERRPKPFFQHTPPQWRREQMLPRRHLFGSRHGYSSGPQWRREQMLPRSEQPAGVVVEH